MNGGTPWLGTVAPTSRMTTASASGERHRLQALDPQLQALERPRRQQLDPDHADDHRHDRHRPQRRRRPGRPGARGRSRRRRGRGSGTGSRRSRRRGRSRAQRSQAGRAPADAAVERVLGDQHRAVEGAPEHEGPGRAVPEPAEHHRDHQVAVGEEAAAAVAAERDVEVVAQEAREGHVPAPPEVAEAGRPVGAVEVLREDEAHQQREPDRDVGVAGEVAVDLGRVGVGGEDRVGGGVGLGDAEHRVDDLAREGVGDQRPSSPARARSAPGRRRPRPGSGRAAP